MIRVTVAAKINLALVVGELRPDGYHDVATLMQRIDLCDTLTLEPGHALEVTGFAEDTLVRRALELLGAEAGRRVEARVGLRKGIPVATGLGGGSADAAAALVAGNELLGSPVGRERLLELAAELGSDVPFFVEPGPKLAQGRGELLTPVDVPQDFWVLVAVPRGAVKESTGAVYGRFDALGGGPGFEQRRNAVLEVARTARRARDLAALPPNDLAVASGAAEFAARLAGLGPFRADVSGAGPAAYGLFHHRRDAEAAARALGGSARTWIAAAVW
ncbi:MAG: 4-(cytidine 5'-diphospho)-2-C-methyl-D-erythritol kinase [Thermoleophilia bacterium]